MLLAGQPPLLACCLGMRQRQRVDCRSSLVCAHYHPPSQTDVASWVHKVKTKVNRRVASRLWIRAISVGIISCTCLHLKFGDATPIRSSCARRGDLKVGPRSETRIARWHWNVNPRFHKYSTNWKRGANNYTAPSASVLRQLQSRFVGRPGTFQH